nr:MAG TPA: hypothetical protein [Bacteriophage sp.]
MRQKLKSLLHTEHQHHGNLAFAMLEIEFKSR